MNIVPILIKSTTCE